MREILFRGRLKAENGELKKGDWVYGDLVTLIDGKEKHLHIYGKGEVKAETIGQFTGLTDKNGKKIFEGDIHEYIVGGKSYLFVVKHGKYYDFEAADKRYGWYFQNTQTNDCNSFYGDEKNYANIIGNIHDNPELLKGGAE